MIVPDFENIYTMLHLGNNVNIFTQNSEYITISISISQKPQKIRQGFICELR